MGGEIGQWKEWNHDESVDWHLLQIRQTPYSPLPTGLPILNATKPKGFRRRCTSVERAEPAEAVELKSPVQDFLCHLTAMAFQIQIGLWSTLSSLRFSLLQAHSLQDGTEQQQDPRSFARIELFLALLLIELPTRSAAL
jgi:hypothetical protein